MLLTPEKINVVPSEPMCFNDSTQGKTTEHFRVGVQYADNERGPSVAVQRLVLLSKVVVVGELWGKCSPAASLFQVSHATRKVGWRRATLRSA